MPEAAARAWNPAEPERDWTEPRHRPRLVDVSASEVPARRTVVINSQAPARRRPAPLAHERIGPRPDRVALYAVLMGVFLILVAALSGHV